MTTLRQREPREVDPEHLAKVRQLPCYISRTGRMGCFGTVAAHHHVTRGRFGSDYQTIPLCAIHHDEVHNGKVSFATKYNVDYDAAIAETNERVA